MKMKISVGVILFSVLLSCLPILAEERAGSPVVWNWSQIDSPVVDVLPLKDGSTCLLIRG